MSISADDSVAVRGLSYAPTDIALAWRGDSVVVGHVESYAARDVTASACTGSGIFLVPFQGGGGVGTVRAGEPVCGALLSEDLDLALTPDLESVIYSTAVPANLSRVVRMRLRDGATDTLSLGCTPYAEDPAISRSGDLLAIKGVCGERNQVRSAVYVRSLSDATWRRVAGGDSIAAEMPSVSPDGRMLAIRLGDSDAPAAARVIATVDVASGEIHPLVPGLNPSWSPDGAWIAYVHRDTASQYDNEVRVIRPDGSSPRTIFRNQTRTTYVRAFGPMREGTVRAPLLWTPDSRGIVFGRTFDRGVSLWHIVLDSAGVRRLTESAQR